MFGTNKYGNKKITTEDGDFDSKREYKRWCELKLLQKAGEISNLYRQVPFGLLPQQRGKDGKVKEKAVKYVADFSYFTKDGEYVVEDAKGYKTDVYKLKKKMMLYFHGIEIKEV